MIEIFHWVDFHLSSSTQAWVRNSITPRPSTHKKHSIPHHTGWCMFILSNLVKNWLCHNCNFNGLMQERCNSSANPLELHLSCTSPLIYCDIHSQDIWNPIIAILMWRQFHKQPQLASHKELYSAPWWAVPAAWEQPVMAVRHAMRTMQPATTLGPSCNMVPCVVNTHNRHHIDHVEIKIWYVLWVLVWYIFCLWYCHSICKFYKLL